MPDDLRPLIRVSRAPRHVHFARTAVVGLCAGLLAVTFRRALALAEAGREQLLAVLHAYPTWGWTVLPAIGLCVGALVAWITIRFAPEAAGSGIPHLKGALLHVRNLEWRRPIPVKFISGVLGIGCGLSLGREGPRVQMGAAVARALAGLLRTPPADVPQLFSAGAGAGLAAAFNAPLAGLIFVVEEPHRELSSRTAAGALIAAVCATVVTQWLAGDTPAFEAHGLSAMPLIALPLTIIVGVLGGLGGVLFNKSLLAALVLVVPAAGGLRSWRPDGAPGRASPEVTSGQATAQAGEPETATTTHPLAAGGTPLFDEADCLTLIETTHFLCGEILRSGAGPMSSTSSFMVRSPRHLPAARAALARRDRLTCSGTTWA